jgi:hypothetical protein
VYRIKKTFKDGSKWVEGDEVNKVYSVRDSEFIDQKIFTFMQDSFEKETQDQEWGCIVLEVSQKKLTEDGITYQILVKGQTLGMCRDFTDIIICKGILCYLFELQEITVQELERLEFQKI